jgi:creatinine amidohydrolase/Fe(II)-dependent formamide hydrolase-like protein
MRRLSSGFPQHIPLIEEAAHVSRPLEEMRPGEIADAAAHSGCAFVPVSPTCEWHSLHLPVGTDALISEALARIGADAVGGVWMRPLPLGLDAWRSPEQLASWGFDEADRIFGMNFPELPFRSDYCDVEQMRAAVAGRLAVLQRMRFRHVFLVNHHGGEGQGATLDAVAERSSTDDFLVHMCMTYPFAAGGAPICNVGGHAGLSETRWLLAFRPELVDLAEQPDGELTVRASGILHRSPVIEAEFNPRNVSTAEAADLRRTVVQSFLAFVADRRSS